MKITVYNLQGGKVKEIDLDQRIFSVKVKPEVIQQAVVAQLAGRHQASAHTKNRGEVRGGGKKPWKQKGTGRARQGSIRSPLWRGGGIVGGPTSARNFTKKINKKARRLAMLAVLSDRLAHERITVIQELVMPDSKTKSLVKIFNNLPIKPKKLLLILGKKSSPVLQAAKNISQLNLLAANSLNIVDLLKSEYLLITESALPVISKVYQG